MMEDFDTKLNAELDSAPSQFLNVINFLSKGDIDNCIKILKRIIPEFEKRGDYWTGAAYCCYAYCLKHLGYWKEAIEEAKKGESFGLNLSAYWYYHDVMVNAMNFIDNMPVALGNVNEAIEFYRKRNSLGNVSYFLSSKANILKQLASEASRELINYPKAKEYVIEAIESIVESYSLFNSDWKESREDLSALSNIAARVYVNENDLINLKKFKYVEDLVKEYFDAKLLAQKAVSENFNRAIDAVKGGDRKTASEFYDLAYKIASEDTEEDKAYKAFLGYQYGICLLHIYNLINYKPSHVLSAEQKEAIIKIQKIWEKTNLLYQSLSKDKTDDFNNRFPPGLTSAVDNIENDIISKIKI